MRISVPLMYVGGLKEAAEQVAAMEQVGLDIAWVAEAYGADGVSLMGYLAARTEHVQIGSGILPIYTRTPTLLAMTAAGVDLLSDGRCILGLGASGPQVIEGFHGVPYDMPLQRTREIIDICRRVWRRERIEHQGRAYTIPLPPDQGTGLGKPLKMITRPVRDRIPIYVAALGNKNVEMTAELADGWLPFLYMPSKAKDVWGEALAKGGANRSPDLAPLEIAAGGLCAIGDDVEGVREFARPMAALYIGGMGAKGRNFYNDLARRYGYEQEAETIQELYLAGKKDEAAAAVPASLLEAMTLCGPEGYVRDRIAEFKEAGVTILNVTPISENPVELVSTLRAVVDTV
jgi:F420-dependent oxidoreductase-like protein